MRSKLFPTVWKLPSTNKASACWNGGRVPDPIVTLSFGDLTCKAVIVMITCHCNNLHFSFCFRTWDYEQTAAETNSSHVPKTRGARGKCLGRGTRVWRRKSGRLRAHATSTSSTQSRHSHTAGKGACGVFRDWRFSKVGRKMCSLAFWGLYKKGSLSLKSS